MDIDSVKMDKVLKSLRSNLTWDSIKYYASLINNTNMEELIEFTKIFNFTDSTVPQYKSELNRWFKNYPSFFADNTNEIISNIRETLEGFNKNSKHTYPFINRVPIYGGKLKIPEKNSQIKWMKTMVYHLPKMLQHLR